VGFLYSVNLLKKNRVITIDLLGHGATDVWDMFKRWRIMPMRFAPFYKLRIRKAICGHSMGGYVALAFAEMYPDTIKGSLLNSTARAFRQLGTQNK
jgi:pimeloyl-ACP methyl ester carboxylesterase